MAKTQTARTQDLVDIKDIRDGIVVLKNGSLRRVVLVEGINFDLKSDEEQALITYAYQTFLNALDFSVQINIHSRKLNTEQYLENLRARHEKEKSELIKIQIEEYVDFVRSFVESNAIMEKSFSVVVPYDPVPFSGGGIPVVGKLKKNRGAEAGVETVSVDREINQSHVEQLNRRVEDVVSNLRGAGLRAVPLEDDELVEFYFNYFNPHTIESQSGVAERTASKEIRSASDMVAPELMEISQGYLKIGEKLSKTLFILGYPRYLSSGWFSSVINFPDLVDISIFIHPTDTGIALKNLRKKATQVEAQLIEIQEKGLVRNPAIETALRDIEALRDALQQSEEKLFQVGVYITIYADSEKDLEKLSADIANTLSNKLIDVKSANFEQLSGFLSTAPLGEDKLKIHSPMNTGPLSSILPFVSLNLTSDNGVMHGVNRHNNTLVIFDRFSMENANMVIFGKAGAGKSYASKLDILRSLMLGSEIIIVDPENEYENLAEAAGGSVFKISMDSESNINPFDLPFIAEDETPSETLKSHIVNLTGLVKLMLGTVSSEEEALLDQAIAETYASRDITPDADFAGKEPPLLEDLEAVLKNTEGGRDMANRLYRFTKGSYAGFVNKPTNVSFENRLIVFSIRDLEEELRPIAMYIILNFIWGLIRAELRQRIMVVDEAWFMMRHEDSASFLYRLAKRARKYYLGITTITQDVEDFLNSPYGKPIITNSSLQLLLKQSPAAIDGVGKAFNLTDVEKNYLIEADIGQGLFAAGLKHAAIQIIPSYFEDRIITTNPKELLEQKEQLEEGGVE